MMMNGENLQITKTTEDYILIYNLNRSKEFDEYAKSYPEKQD